ncbi:MAG: SIMPL domain-containing protein [Pyrinomonadaceae bacterium]
MRRLFLLIVSLSCVSTGLAQESGNRIYGNYGYYNQQRRQPQTNTGTLFTAGYGYSIEASVLTNLKPDAFVVVFGINDEANAPAESNAKVNGRVADFTKALTALGIARSDIFVDFITQNRVYDYEMQGGQATENFSGFETKKTIAVRYRNRDLFERIVEAAAGVKIFDLIKVDYIVSDFQAVRKRLFDEAVKVIKTKERSYIQSLGVGLTPVGLANERYDAFYPSDTYERYQAYETGSAYVSSNTIVRRKSFTFFYEPVEGSRFDAVLNPRGIEPAVQFSVYLRVQYDQQKSKQG